MKSSKYTSPHTDIIYILQRSSVLLGSSPIDIDYGGSEEEGVADTRHQVLWGDDDD